MRLFVRAKPSSRVERVERNPDGSFTVWVTEPPIENRANRAILEALARFLGVPRSRIQPLKGRTGRLKVFEIKD